MQLIYFNVNFYKYFRQPPIIESIMQKRHYDRFIPFRLSKDVAF